MSLSPNNTYTLEIGIGPYAAGDAWDLPAAVPDALRFLRWLLDRGVPSDEIEVFLSPTDDKAEIAVPNGVNAYEATRDAIVFKD